jgi:hypothetical protein
MCYRCGRMEGRVRIGDRRGQHRPHDAGDHRSDQAAPFHGRGFARGLLEDGKWTAARIWGGRSAPRRAAPSHVRYTGRIVETTGALPMQLSRWRSFDPKTKLRSGWYGRGKMTRKAYAEAVGVSVVVVKAWDRGAKPRAGSLAKIAALQKLVSADRQCEILPPNRAAEKAAAKAERDRDRWLDKMLAQARKPLSKRARQRDLFS